MKEIKFVLNFENKFLVFGERRLKTPIQGDFEYNIQETALFGDRGLNVIVASNAKGEKLYFRKGAVDVEGNTELEPLTESELKRYGIQETACQNSKYYVFETENQDESDSGKTTKFDVTNPEDMKKAKRIAEKMLEAQGESSLSINSDATETERETATKNALYETMKTKLAERLEEQGISVDVENLTVEQMNGYTQMLRKLEQKKNPLRDGQEVNSIYSQGQQTGRISRIDLENEGFDSVESLIVDLRQKSHSHNEVEKAEAEAILKELWKKYGEELRANHEDPRRGTLPITDYEDKPREGRKPKTLRQQQEGDI